MKYLFYAVGIYGAVGVALALKDFESRRAADAANQAHGVPPQLPPPAVNWKLAAIWPLALVVSGK